ncbi:BlaR1 family beta-lactam sensor/signal transducer [Clostridium tagluense]|nr:BlaR1 family beta-lactam sensor/signal transducer [Clostridium tagluense]
MARKIGEFIMLISKFFSYLIYSSITSSIVIFGILLIKILFNKKLGARWNYYIWFILILKLLIPYFPQGPVSIDRIISFFSSIAHKSMNITNVTVSNNSHKELSMLMDSTKDYAISINRDYSIFYILWLMVFLIGFALIVITNIKLRAGIKDKPQIYDENIKVLLEGCKKDLNINHSINIVRIDGDRCPAIFGFINPYILIPDGIEEKITQDEMRYILLHELAHYKRKDMAVSLLISLLQLIYWFNPIIYYGFYLMKKDMEIACDGHVLSKINEEEIKGYGLTIIKLLELIAYNRKNIFTLGIIKNKNNARNRIKMIAGFKKDSKGIVLSKTVVFIILTGMFLGSTQGNAMVKDKKVLEKNSDYKDLSRFYKGVEGSFVLFDVNKGDYIVYNKEKSEKRVSPCSTYKIVEALIGLETGAIKDEKELFKWDGSKYPYREWNQDNTLFSAMKYSVNWYFEEVDRKIGKNKLKYYIDKMDYGNKDIYSLQADYWLQASLKISPIEQVEMLKKMYNYELPFSKKNIDIVKNSMKIMEDGERVMYGKTGSGDENNKEVNGWFVGYIEENNDMYFFATNIEGKNGATGVKAKEITLQILRDLGNVMKK